MLQVPELSVRVVAFGRTPNTLIVFITYTYKTKTKNNLSYELLLYLCAIGLDANYAYA